MKLLGWMHRKFRQNSCEPFKDLSIGNACNCLSGQQSLVEDEQNHHKPNHGIIKHFKQNYQKPQSLRNSFAGLESAIADNEDHYYDGEESDSSSMHDLFPGFLAIGTLGSDQQVISDYPSTPTFTISVESITEKEDEVTENELKLINDELEKVLGAQTNDDVSNDSSGRNSHVSTGRNSHVSSVGRSSHVSSSAARMSHVSIMEGVVPNAVCPLQGYLFGTTIESSETTAKGAKKENRTSLGELFQRSKLTEENLSAKSEREGGDKYSAMNMVKEKLKRKILNASSSKSSSSMSGGASVDSAAETKLNKILHMFRKKVHPESSASAQKSAKHRKHENKIKRMMNEGGYNNKGDMVLHAEDLDEDPFGTREHWIKTDADYLVLEL